MKYYKNPETNEVYAYFLIEQQDLIQLAIDSGWEDVTESWPPPSKSTETAQELSAEEKLSRLGLSVDELKRLLSI